MKMSEGLSYNSGLMYKKNYTFNMCDTACIMNVLKEHKIEEASVVAWMFNGIYWGTVHNSDIALLDIDTINWTLCQEIRIFNHCFELHLIKGSNCMTGRIVIDCEGDSTRSNTEVSEYVDTVSRFWGEYYGDGDNKKIVLRDVSRKLSLSLPIEKIGDMDARFYGLKTRNYIVKDPNTYQVGYGDYRYVDIVPIK